MSTVAAYTCRQETLDVINPYDGSLVGQIPKATKIDAEMAIENAVGYDYRLTAWQRYDMLSAFCELLLQHRDEIIKTISLESGKTLKDASVELTRAHQAFLLSAEEAKRIDGQLIPLDAVAGMPQDSAMVMREPVGLVTAITPFNYPLNLVAHKVGPALAANNPVIVKPASSTPLTALRMAQLMYEAGVPFEMLQVLVGDASELGDILVTDNRVKKVSFTGSVEIGKAIFSKAGMKAISMELGGNDPMIVLKDADLDAAIPIAIDGAYGNNGERCTSVKRFIVEDAIADEFIERFIDATRLLRVGDQMDLNTDVGPLINEREALTISQRVQSAVTNGARLRLGGKRSGALLWPVVLDHVDMNNPIVVKETFGPVAPFIRVADFDEAIQVANDSEYGLQAGVFTNDLRKAKRAIREIEAGGVMINKAPGFRAEHLPFGGIKDSGIGREGIKYAVQSMTRIKTAVM